MAHSRPPQFNTGLPRDGAPLQSHDARTGGTRFGDAVGPNVIEGSNAVAGVASCSLAGCARYAA